MTGGIVGTGNTEPADFAAVEFDRVVAHDVLENQRRRPGGDGQSIGFDAIVKMIRGDNAARAGHVLDDARRIAR